MRCHSMLSDAETAAERLSELADIGDAQGPWGLYNRLIAGIPEDVLVTDYALGLHWSYLEAECGAGVSYTVTGGGAPIRPGDLRGLPLHSVAALAKSWNFDEATLGVAALGAWYGQRALLEDLGATFEPPKSADIVDADTTDAEAAAGSPEDAAAADDVDPIDQRARRRRKTTDAFAIYEPLIREFSNEGEPARVVVVGHFPHLAELRSIADLTILERNCRSPFDTPDPACEYVIPDADFAFFTGVTLINKTAPRLLALAQRAETIFVGPSVVAAPELFDYGVAMVAGRTVVDPERVRASVTSGEPFGDALQSFSVKRSDTGL